MKQLTIPILLFTVNLICAQEETVLLGKVTNDSLSVEGIHVFNKSSGKGTITNQNGEFNMPVKLNDTLSISGIQFFYREILITKDMILHNRIAIDLYQKINVLEAVEISNHLIGNLAEDAATIQIPKSKINPMALNFSMIDFSKPVTQNIDEIDRAKPPDIMGLVDPAYMKGIGGTIGLKKRETSEEKKLKALENRDDFNKKIKKLLSEK
ncbi:MAG: hypothetical protein KDC56_10030, partial [Flavobacteriaceae bacterium]|nr:hypothetical protein [Flavobacteriaceae bacterium]